MNGRLAALALILAAVAGFHLGGLAEQLSIVSLKSHLADLRSLYAARPWAVIGAFIAIQATALALCLPGAVLSMSLAGGAVFGPWLGAAVVLGGVTLGDSLGFVLARYVARDFVTRRFGRKLARIEASDSAAYLLALRMMAVVPYFIVNIAMALTPMKLRVFAPVSLAGLVPATLLYVHAGAALSEIEGPGDIYTPMLIACFLALGTLPLAARWAYRRWGTVRPASSPHRAVRAA